MNKSYFSYIRVSTTRQGQTGTSLTEQREAIRRYSERFSLSIVKEYEEQETAAKRGRPVFADMLRALKSGRGAGIVMHKIDRGARNLKDWADLGEMIDQGIDVHFVNESLDLQSRGGRLSADIQAVVAADYIRNLREETKKGFYGRLKQGLYPMPAPTGYTDCGQGQPKALHPSQAPLIRQAFEMYATGTYSLRTLAEKMSELGLVARGGGHVARNTVHDVLRNPFYTGLIRIKKTGEMFPGNHEPIIPTSLFDRVQVILSGKHVIGERRHQFLYRKHLICESCRKVLIPELQKGHVYYRCQTRECPQKTVREEVVETAFIKNLKQLHFDSWEWQYFCDQLKEEETEGVRERNRWTKGFTLELEQIKTRLSKLTDAYLDSLIEQDVYVHKKNDLLMREQAINERLSNTDFEGTALIRVREVLELANNAYSSYKLAIFEERREMVKSITSNFIIREKIVIPKLHFVFQIVSEREKIMDGGPQRDVARNLSGLISQLRDYFTTSDQTIQLPSPKHSSGSDFKR